jgi:hypothetical protein
MPSQSGKSAHRRNKLFRSRLLSAEPITKSQDKSMAGISDSQLLLTVYFKIKESQLTLNERKKIFIHGLRALLKLPR